MDEKRKKSLKLKPPFDDEAQSKRFVETAQELEADETCTSFDSAFGIVASSGQKVGSDRCKDKT